VESKSPGTAKILAHDPAGYSADSNPGQTGEL